MTRLDQATIDTALAGIGKVEAQGARGTTMVSFDEIRAMAILAIGLGLEINHLRGRIDALRAIITDLEDQIDKERGHA